VFVHHYQAFAWFEIGITPREIVVDIPQARQSLAILTACIEQASKEYAITPAHVLLIGFSQGATMAALAALTRPDLVAGAAILSGIEPSPFLEQPLDAAALTGRRFLVVHGTQDVVVPVEQGHATRDFLIELGVPVEYHEYPVGHGISQEGLLDLAAWVRDAV
jgi:phospholipase/carboxylesterase